MLTLTVSSKQFTDPAEAAQELKRGLRLLRLHLKRHQRLENFEFLAIFEAHKSGFPHLHLLIKGKFLPWKWLKNRWSKITGSTHVDIRRIKGGRDAARYVAKYLGKDLHAFPGCKRYWRSHGYAPAPANDDEPKRPGEDWSRMYANFDGLEDWLRSHGWETTKVPGSGFMGKPPPNAVGGLRYYIAAYQSGRPVEREGMVQDAMAWLTWGRRDGL